MEETLRTLVSLGFAMLLVVLRFDAPRFGVAETRDAVDVVPRALARRRVGWYGLAVAIVAAILLVHPDPPGALGLGTGELGPALGLGLLAVVVGVAQAVLVASLRGLPLAPAVRGDTPWAVGDAAATALVDEAAFRGALLGFLTLAGVPPLAALLVQAILYALATGTPGARRDRYLLAVAIGVGLVGGTLALLTGGIAAPFAGHAAARVAMELLGIARPGGGGALARARS